MESMGLYGRHASDGFAPPDHRYRVAKKCHDDGRCLPFGVDGATRRLFRFLRARDSASDFKSKARVLAEYADLAAASKLRRRKHRWQRDIIEAYLVAAADAASISCRVGVSEEAVVAYGSSYYDIGTILKSPIRALHELIGSFHGRNDFDWDVSRLYKWVGYKLGLRGLDMLFGMNDRANRPLDNLADLVTEQSRSILQLKHLVTMSQMNANDSKHRELLVKLWEQEQTRRQKEGVSLNPYEQQFEALLKEIPWAMGSDAEQIYDATPLGKYDTGTAALRDEELWRVMNGESIDADLPDKLPPPRPRSPQGDVGNSAFSPPANSGSNPR